MKLWILWQAVDEKTISFQGAFSARDLAVAAARDETYFAAPYDLDELLPHETVPWPEETFYPLLEEATP